MINRQALKAISRTFKSTKNIAPFSSFVAKNQPAIFNAEHSHQQQYDFSTSIKRMDQGHYSIPDGNSIFFAPSQNAIGVNSVEQLGGFVTNLGCKKILVVTDKPLVQIGIVAQVTKVLEKAGVSFVIFDNVQPNPTVSNVNEGLKIMQKESCDGIVSIGGGSVHDCAKGIGLVKGNGGKIEDYEGLDKSKKPICPYIAVNTTAGTAAELTRFSIITNEVTRVKMAIVDKNVTPTLSLNDPVLMMKQPPFLTACTGLDALTHAIEAYVSTAANPITDACALMAIELIGEHLSKAVANGTDIYAREKMCYAQFLAGLAFNNASLGYVHAIAHQLGGYYNLPHGFCNAILLPSVMKFNIPAHAKKLARVAKTLGVKNVDNMSDYDAAYEAVKAVCKLRELVGIPSGLSGEKIVKREDFDILADHALKDVCGFTNPRVANKKDIIAILEESYKGL